MLVSEQKNTTHAVVSPSSTISKLEFKELLKANGYPRRLISKLSERWSELHDTSNEDEQEQELLQSVRQLIELMNQK
jgi:hypothetical protein